jgi:hypothetical protein
VPILDDPIIDEEFDVIITVGDDNIVEIGRAHV